MSPRNWSPTRRAVVAIVILSLLMHRGYFSSGVLVAGDMLWLSPQNLDMYVRMPTTWNLAEGLGANGLGLANFNLNVEPLNIVLGSLGQVLPFGLVQRLVIFLPAALLPGLLMFWFMGRFTGRASARFAAAMVYSANTFILTISVQHLYLALVYALAPFVWGVALGALDKVKAGAGIGRLIAGGLGFAAAFTLVMAIDARMALLVMVPVVLLFVVELVKSPGKRGLLVAAAATVLGVLAFQAYWIVPSLFGGGGSAYEGVVPETTFVSFFELSHALTLQHPFYNGSDPAWFQAHPVTLAAFVLPLIALAGLWALPEQRRRPLMVFVVTLCVGIFFAKGTNAPFGSVYTFMFENVPGMQLFREPSKFMMWVAAGYALLIGVFVDRCVAWLSSREPMSDGWRALVVNVTKGDAVQRSIRLDRLVAIATIAALTVTTAYGARAALGNDMGWTTTSVQVPSGELAFARHLERDTNFARVLWLPASSRFASLSEQHPRITAEGLLSTARAIPGAEMSPDQLIVEYERLTDLAVLRHAGVGYVAVPSDLDADYWADLFPNMAQRKATYNAYIERLSQPGFAPMYFSPSLVVYRVIGSQSLFTGSEGTSIDETINGKNAAWGKTGQLEYSIRPDSQHQIIRMAEKYDKGWVATSNDKRLEHVELNDGTNAWRVPAEGAETITVRYTPQTVANWSALVSLLSLVAALGFLLALRRRQPRQ